MRLRRVACSSVRVLKAELIHHEPRVHLCCTASTAPVYGASRPVLEGLSVMEPRISPITEPGV